MDLMPKLKHPASRFSIFLVISANILFFGVFYFYFVIQSQIPYEGQLLVSKSRPLPSGGSSNSPFSSSVTDPFATFEDIPTSDEKNKFSTVPPIPSAQRILCKVLNNRNCNSYFIAGNADLVWVIAPIYAFNTKRGEPYRILHNLFKGYINSFGFNFITIEAIRFPNETRNPISDEETKYTTTQPDKEPYDIQVYYYNVTYIRENLLNVAIQKLDKLASWDYVMWIDAHHFFENPYWWEDGIYKIEKSGAVQMFDKIEKIDDNNKTYVEHFSITRMSLFADFFVEYQIVYGNAYILTKDLYNQIGYIYDECIATSCDCAYVLASFPNGVGWPPIAPNYYKTFDPWINHTKTVFKNRRTYVRGVIKHFHHGKLFPYVEIQKMIDTTDFDPKKDIGRDSNYSIYVKNDYVSKRMEEIILNSVNSI